MSELPTKITAVIEAAKERGLLIELDRTTFETGTEYISLRISNSSDKAGVLNATMILVGWRLNQNGTVKLLTATLHPVLGDPRRLDTYGDIYGAILDVYTGEEPAHRAARLEAAERAEQTKRPLPSVNPLLDTDEIDYESAYRKGWDASRRTTTYDLDAAEARFEKRYGEWYSPAFNRGWNDYAADRSFDPSRTDDERDAESGA